MQKGRASHALGARRSLGAYKRRGRKMRNRTHDDGVAPGWKRALVNALRCVLRLTVVFGPLSLPLLMKTDSVIAARASAPAFGWVRQQNKDKHVHERTHNYTHTNTHTHTHVFCTERPTHSCMQCAPECGMCIILNLHSAHTGPWNCCFRFHRMDLSHLSKHSCRMCAPENPNFRPTPG